MKKRTISAIVMLLIAIPIILLGDVYFQLGVLILLGYGLYELFKVKKKDNKIPLGLEIISYAFLLVFFLTYYKEDAFSFVLDFRFIIGLLLISFAPVVFYHNDKKYSVVDATYLFFVVFLLGFSFLSFVLVRNIDLSHFCYILLITIITDTFAYFTGMLIGKHKLCESLSPNKTIEGAIGGTMMGTIIATAFYMTVINSTASFAIVLLFTFILSIVSQIGDLFFSSIKRHFEVKDYSNLIPGHGGILDRLDSLIFVVITYILFISIL